MQAAAAMQKQITRDFTPFWGLRVTVDVFEDLESVPTDYHPVVLFAAPEELVGSSTSPSAASTAEHLIDDFERERWRAST